MARATLDTRGSSTLLPSIGQAATPSATMMPHWPAWQTFNIRCSAAQSESSREDTNVRVECSYLYAACLDHFLHRCGLSSALPLPRKPVFCPLDGPQPWLRQVDRPGASPRNSVRGWRCRHSRSLAVLGGAPCRAPAAVGPRAAPLPSRCGLRRRRHWAWPPRWL